MRTWMLLSLLAAAAPTSPTAAEVGPDPAQLFAEAQELAGEGRGDDAMVALSRAVDAGYVDYYSLISDEDLAALRERPDWSGFFAGFQRKNAWVRVLDTDVAAEGYPWLNYVAGWRATAAGTAPDAAMSPAWPQIYSQLSAVVGDYDQASRTYLGGPVRKPASEVGVDHLVPALPVIREMARERRIVMLNESHGRSIERAANFMVVRELRKLGFTHLALEALAVEKVDDGGCRSAVIADPALNARGHAVASTGYYTNDPVYAELLRMAVAEGYQLVAYERMTDLPVDPVREQHQARNIACILEDDPAARIVVLGGGGHISEDPEAQFPGGVMGARLKLLTGFDPLTIANRTMELQGLPEDPVSAGYRDPENDGVLAGQPYLATRAQGGYQAAKGYDLVAFIPPIVARSPDAGWLSLGGWRTPAPATPLVCAVAPCQFEARRVGESADAVPGDRCVVHESGRSCQLFVGPGEFEVSMLDADGVRSAAHGLPPR